MSPARTALFVLSLLLLVLGGCGGGSYIHLNLMRDVSHDKPVYVGVYFLSQEAAIDAAAIPDLIDNPEEFTEGVVAKQVLPVYPGEVKPVPMENYDPLIRWIAIVADFGTSAECTRDKKAVPAGSKLEISVAIEADCIQLNVQ
jgi:predicted component of type VI protein secretion system